MTREDIIRMAREAGWEDAPTVRLAFAGFDIHRFAALVAAASEEQWKHAVINELVCCHIYNAAHDSDPRKALHDAISWNVQVAIDPQVSSDAQALIDRGAAAERDSWPAEMEAMERQVNILTDALAQAKAEEREACAKVCEDIDAEYEGEDVLATWCAAAIRARGNDAA